MRARFLFPLLAFILLLGLPLSEIFQRSLVSAAFVLPSADFFRRLFNVCAFTLEQAALSTLASLGVGIPLGVFYGRRWHPAIRGFATASFALPSVVLVGTVSFLLRGTSIRYGLPAVILGHLLLNAPWIALATADGIRSLPKSWIEAARSLGANPARAFIRIELPWVSRGIALATAQVFGFCVMSFALVLMLGGGPPVSTLETEIYASVRGGGLELREASLFAIAQLLFAALPLGMVSVFPALHRASESLAAWREGGEEARDSRSHVGLSVAVAWFLIPGLALLGSLSNSGAMHPFSALFADSEWRHALFVSGRIAFASAVLACGLGAGFAYAAGGPGLLPRLVRVMASLPAGMSPLVLCLGFFLAYSRWIDPFEGSELGMVIVEATLFLPFALRIFLPLLEGAKGGWRRHSLDAARTLGATPAMAWRKLEWPRWSSALDGLFRLVFVWSFADVAAASFFGSEKLNTVGITLFRWMAQYRFEEVNAALFVLYLFSALALLSRK